MPESAVHRSGEHRLQLLEALGLLKAKDDSGVAALARAARQACATSSAAVSVGFGPESVISATAGIDREDARSLIANILPDLKAGSAFFEIDDIDSDQSVATQDLKGIRSFAAAPIVIAGVPLGSLTVMSAVANTLSAGQRETLLSLADATAELFTRRPLKPFKNLPSKTPHDAVEELVEELSAVEAVERKLEDERHQLASVIEATEVAIWEFDVVRDEVAINERWASLIGYAKTDLEPVSIDTFESRIHIDDLALMRDNLEKHLTGGARDFECDIRMRHRDGHWIWIMTRGRVVERDEEGNPLRMFGVHLDIRERKEQEAYSKQLSSLLESTGRLGRIGGWDLNLLTNDLIWTDETKRIHGVPLDYEPDLQSAINFYAPEAREEVGAAVDTATKTGQPWDLEVPLIRANGARIWVHAQGCAVFEEGRPVRLFGAFQDITERRALLQSVSEGRELHRVTLESIGDGVITTDPYGRITWLNPVAERLTGWSPDIARGLSVNDVYHLVTEGTREPVENPISRCLVDQRVVKNSSDTMLLARNGTEHGIEDSAAPIINDEGDLLGAVMVFHDVTEQRRLSGEMRYRARHDSLTGLSNRAEFESRLEQLLLEAASTGSEHGVLYIDLDQFKVVNDTCGHAIGDKLLQKVASILAGSVRSVDTVARLGGDEFGMILERCPARQTARVAEQVCQQIRDFRFVHEEHRFRVGSSIGLVQMHGGWADVSSVLQAADTACYAAKEAGRDRVHIYADADEAIVNQRSETQWIRRIEAALENDRFVTHFQPIVPSQRREWAGSQPRMELLLRMVGEDDTLIPPAAFLQVAERFKLITRIDRWVTNRAIEFLSEEKLESATLFVNLSGVSITDPVFQDFTVAAFEALEESQRQRIVFEITETAMISNLPLAREFLERLQKLGVNIALDDFGSGMASYGYLKSLPLNYMKIDGQFVSSMLDDELALAAVRSFIDVASILKIPTIAEHVDNEAVLKALGEMGVTYCQGYHLGRPGASALDCLPRETITTPS
ncbi:MAG: EAL domain-containing protein [Pseudomonadota bacterium]